jgi:hypothetical protein
MWNELEEKEKMMIDQQIQEFHEENIDHFFENIRLLQTLFQEIQNQEEEYKKKMNKISIPKMRVMNQEIEFLHHQMKDLSFQMKEYIYQLHQNQLMKNIKNSLFQKIIEERMESRRLLLPIWQFLINSA